MNNKQKIEFLEYLIKELRDGNSDSFIIDYIENLNNPFPVSQESMDTQSPKDLIIDFLQSRINILIQNETN